MTNPDTFRVVAVNLKTHERRVMATGLTECNADAYVNTAVMRRGMDVECFISERE